MKRFKSLIAILALLSFVTPVFADEQILTLNTGFDHGNNTAYNLTGSYPLPTTYNPKDDYWILTYDPSTNGGNPIPRVSDIIPPYYPPNVWKDAMADSQWIAFAKNGVPTANGKNYRAYIFEKCFCLKKGFDRKEALDKTKLDIKFRADDWAAVFLNETQGNILANAPPSFSEPLSILHTTITPPTGGFSHPNPAQISLSGSSLVKRLRVGRNCLQVKLYDLGLVVSGFNLTGTLQASGIEEVAKGAKPETQFSSCSSCTNKRIRDEVKEAIEIKLPGRQ